MIEEYSMLVGDQRKYSVEDELYKNLLEEMGVSTSPFISSNHEEDEDNV